MFHRCFSRLITYNNSVFVDLFKGLLFISFFIRYCCTWLVYCSYCLTLGIGLDVKKKKNCTTTVVTMHFVGISLSGELWCFGFSRLVDSIKWLYSSLKVTGNSKEIPNETIMRLKEWLCLVNGIKNTGGLNCVVNVCSSSVLLDSSGTAPKTMFLVKMTPGIWTVNLFMDIKGRGESTIVHAKKFKTFRGVVHLWCSAGGRNQLTGSRCSESSLIYCMININ